MFKNHKKLITILIFIVLALIIIDCLVGYHSISIEEMILLFQGKASKTTQLTLIHFRLPRVFISLLVGFGLSLSGCVLQGVTRNELADPGILGINAGAGLVVALYITIFSTSLTNAPFGIFIAAFIGAVCSALLVYGLSYIKNEGITANRLLLTGISITALLSAITMIILLRMKQNEYGFIAGWLSGNLWGATWHNVYISFIILLIVFSCMMYVARHLNILSLGQDLATALGASVQKQNIIFLIGAVILASVCVAVGGGISFVGLICPHIAKKFVGPKHQIVLPVSALIGMILMGISDIISRTIVAPKEVSIGIVAVIIGAPYFIYLLAHQGGK